MGGQGGTSEVLLSKPAVAHSDGKPCLPPALVPSEEHWLKGGSFRGAGGPAAAGEGVVGVAEGINYCGGVHRTASVGRTISCHHG